jgi:hypothetical protein
LGVAAQADPGVSKDVVADFEFRDGLADGFDLPGKLGPQNVLPRTKEPNTKRAIGPKPLGIARLRARQSVDETVVARILIRTSRSFGLGLSTSSILTRCGGP